jgi:hypothetical protein
MADKGLAHRPPGVQIHVGPAAVNAAVGKFQQAVIHSLVKVRIIPESTALPEGAGRVKLLEEGRW